MEKRVRRVRKVRKSKITPKIKKEQFELENEIEKLESEIEIDNFGIDDLDMEDIFVNTDFESRVKPDDENVIEDQSFETEGFEENIEKDNKESFAYQEEDNEEKVSLKEALNFKITKKTILIFLGIIIAASALGFGLYKLFPVGRSFNGIVNLNDTLSNGKVECVVEDVVVTDTISTVKAGEGKTFVCIYYEFTNISDKEIKWEDFPYITLGIFESDDVGSKSTKILENESINKDALREYSYVMGLDLRDDLDPLAASSNRDDVDVFEIDKSYLTSNKIYILFDIYDKAIKVEEGLSTLPNLDETIEENQEEIKKEQEEMGIQETPQDSENSQ